MLLIVDRRGLRYASPAAARLWGYSEGELEQLTLEELLHPESRPAAATLTPPLDGTASGRDQLLRIRRKDGGSRWLRLNLVPLELDGEPVVLGSGIDVTELRRARAALRQSQESLELVQRAARSLYWEWEPESDRLSLGAFADELFGFAVLRSVRTGREFIGLVHPEDRARLRQALVTTLKHAEDLALELRFVSPAGEVRWLAERAVAVRDRDGWTRRVIGVAHDISERKIAEEALFQEKEKADVTLASIADGVLRTDDRGMVDYLNPVAQKLTGWSLAEAYGRPAAEVYRVADGVTGEPVVDPLGQCLRERRASVFVGDRLLLDREGDQHPIQESTAPIRDRRGGVSGAVLVFRDLSRLQQIELELDRLTSHDALTGLINRRAFVARLERTLAEGGAEARQYALCHFDLDNFRLVNDTGGHAAGDLLIQQTATLIRGHLGARDLVAHLGGDSFAVLLRDCSAAGARDRAEELRQAIRAARFVWADHTFNTQVSAGLVAIDGEPESAEALLRDADAACVVAKESGGDRLHASRPGDGAIARRYGQMQWVARINKAFEEDRFTLFQQTIVPLQEDSTAAALSELLIRLIDESGELINPGSFIPAAERFGIITEIDCWVFRTTLKLLAERVGDGPARCFTINISGSSLGVSEFLDLVISEFERTGVDPGRILFEITETSAIADLARAQRFLTALKGMGCRFILDDFGKGLSSLGYLKNLPLDFLKIDGSFVRDMIHDPVQASLVASIHQIGEIMGLQTIAESVEDEETLRALRQVGIDYAQGFLLARPEPLARDLPRRRASIG